MASATSPSKIDPVGRTFSYIYAENGIDLLEIRQTRAGQNELLSKMTYNAQHLPLTSTDAAGQTTTYTYNDSWAGADQDECQRTKRPPIFTTPMAT